MEFYNCDISEDAKKFVNEVLNSGYLNQGRLVRALEEDMMPEYVDVHYPLLTNSCTAALHIALELSNVRGKEVILPGKTFIATGMAVLMAGGKPVFCDVEIDTRNLSLETVKPLVNENTAAVIGVSYGGLSCSLELRKIKETYKDISIIEDAAHAFGNIDEHTSYIDHRCYSFQAIKVLSCGDGGMIASRMYNQHLKAKAMRWFGINKDKMTFDPNGKRRMQVESYGYKYNMNDLNAAILGGNLKEFHKRKSARYNVAQILSSNLGKFPAYKNSSFWLFGILAKNSDDWIKRANAEGIPARKMDSDISGHGVFGFDGILKNTRFIDENEIYFPCHHMLTFGDVGNISNFLKKIKDSGDLIC